MAQPEFIIKWISDILLHFEHLREKIESRQFGWYGHANKMDESKYPKKITGLNFTRGDTVKPFVVKK